MDKATRSRKLDSFFKIMNTLVLQKKGRIPTNMGTSMLIENYFKALKNNIIYFLITKDTLWPLHYNLLELTNHLHKYCLYDPHSDLCSL